MIQYTKQNQQHFLVPNGFNESFVSNIVSYNILIYDQETLKIKRDNANRIVPLTIVVVYDLVSDVANLGIILDE